MRRVKTFTAIIWVGLKVRKTGKVQPAIKAKRVIQSYCDKMGFCVSVTPTEFIYTKGGEPGLAVGIINYPRFPMDAESLKRRTETLAQLLMAALKQERVSIVFRDKTVMLENRISDSTQSLIPPDAESTN